MKKLLLVCFALCVVTLTVSAQGDNEAEHAGPEHAQANGHHGYTRPLHTAPLSSGRVPHWPVRPRICVEIRWRSDQEFPLAS